MPPDPTRRLRRVKTPQLPDGSSDFVLRPHTLGALVVELSAVVVVLFVAVDAVRTRRWPVVIVAVLGALAGAVAAGWAYRRSTRTTPAGLVIRDRDERTIPWSEIDGFELRPRRWGRRDQLAARVGEELISFPHPDAKSLTLRPALARAWYAALIDRLEARRR